MKITMTRLRAKTVPKGTRKPEEVTSGFFCGASELGGGWWEPFQGSREGEIEWQRKSYDRGRTSAVLQTEPGYRRAIGEKA